MIVDMKFIYSRNIYEHMMCQAEGTKNKKRKVQSKNAGPVTKIMKAFKVIMAGHYAKPGAFFSAGIGAEEECATAESLGPEARLPPKSVGYMNAWSV